MPTNWFRFVSNPTSDGQPPLRRRCFTAPLAPLALLAVCSAVITSAGAQVNVTTQLNDIGRTGQNLNETVLTPSNVNPAQFGKLFSHTLTGAVGAQPLYLSGLTINGATHNVIYVVTQPNRVYAFDADSNVGVNASPLWFASLLTTEHGAAPGAKIYGDLGSVGTAVIDPASNTLYIVSTTLEGSSPVFRLHALDVLTGAEKFGGPVVITASVSGTAPDGVNGIVSFVPREHRQRPGLLLLNGIVYVSFGSYQEVVSAVWHGWVMGYDATTLAQTGVFCTSPNSGSSGIWMAGDALAADQLDPVNNPYGRIFVATGNGEFVVSSSGTDYGDSILNLNLNGGAPTVTDSFTPSKAPTYATHDTDQGSAGVLILPAQSGTATPNLLVQTGKSGTLYLLDRENLGGYHSTDQVLQALPLAVGNVGAWNSPAYWNGNVYYWGTYDNLKQFPLVNGLLSTPPMTSTETSLFPGATPSISANGNQDGIVWTINADAWQSGGPSILEAHDATNVATTLYSSATDPDRDQAGPAVKFAIPTVVNGKVYVGTAGQINVYGLLNNTLTSTPTISPGSQSFVASDSVTITDSTANAAIYYTTDGTAAGTSSTLYSGPITVQSTQTISAVALAPGLGISLQTSAAYTQAQTAIPVFSPAAVTYSGPQAITLSDATTGATIYYTIDGTKPTVASAVYSSPITVSFNETLRAIATAPGYLTSAVASASYTIGNSSDAVDYDTGFVSAAALNLVGTPAVSNNTLQMSVSSTPKQVNAAWYTTPVNIQAFTTDFYFQESSAKGDGFTFTLQNAPAGLYALGTSAGGGLGYQGIPSSVAVKFDLFDNVGEGADSTGFYTNGASPTLPAVDMTGNGVYLHGADPLHAHITYDGTTLSLTLIDTVTSASFTTSAPLNIPNIVGASTAYVGFTASTSGAAQTSTQTILNWTYFANSGPSSMAATPTYTPAPGVYGGAQSITIGDSTPGATLYYTTDGTIPNTSSSVGPGPIRVGANETLSAIAVAPGYSTSAVGLAAYQIAGPAPTFSPIAGDYSSAQSVAITDAVSGSTIYYTTDGTAPTTASTVYSGPVTVAVSETLKAIALPPGYSQSAAAAAIYKIQLPVPTPVITPAAGKYTSAQSVTITDTATGAIIYYTTDGTAPKNTSAVYSGPITVSVSETVKAMAVATGYSPSTIAVAAFNISD